MALGLRCFPGLVGAWLACIVGPATAADVRVVGSDLLGQEFFKALHIFAAREKIPLATAFDGSRSGLEDVRSGRSPLALVTLPRDEEAHLLAGLEALPIGWHRVVVLVPASSPLEQITLPQLAGIFGREAPVSLNRWGDLGLEGEWAGSPITAHAPAAGEGVALGFFRRAVLNGGALKNFVGRYRTMEDLGLRLAGESRAIALASTPLPVEAGAKALAVATGAGPPAFRPTPENLASGDYPLGLPVRAVFLRALWPQVGPLVKFALGEESAAALERAGLVTGAPAGRQRDLHTLEKRLRENLQK